MTDESPETHPAIEGSTSLTASTPSADEGRTLEQTAKLFERDLSGEPEPPATAATHQPLDFGEVPDLRNFTPETWEQVGQRLPGEAVNQLRFVQQAQLAITDHLQKEQAELPRLIPSWSDPAVRQRESRELTEYLRAEGWDDQELAELNLGGKAKHLKALRAAMLKDRGEVSADEPRSPTRNRDPEQVFTRDAGGKFSSPKRGERRVFASPDSLSAAAERISEIMDRSGRGSSFELPE